MMSMGPALISEEMDDSVDLTPGHMFHHISVYCGRCLHFAQWIHALCTYIDKLETGEGSQTTAV